MNLKQTSVKKYFPFAPLLFCLLLSSDCFGQSPTLPFPLATVETSLGTYREPSIGTRRFKLRDLTPLIAALPTAFGVDTAGLSVEGRPVHRIDWGGGATEVLLWSQMHGNEPTATAALFDLFRWLGGSGDGLDDLRRLFADRLHLTFLPMLNPDGAEVYERRNALGIDLNRDALDLTSPESRILKSERDRLDADWGFNLHDQGIYYSAGFPAERGCVLSILAPAYDWQKSMNEQRGDAARLIALMNGYWQREVPGQVGRYNDDFEPRAFGDNLQKWGTRTILIESGGYPGDPEKQRIRRLNLLGLLAGLHAIASGSYATVPLDDYWAIPENQSNGMHEVIVENVALPSAGDTFVMDVGFRLNEQTTGRELRRHTTSGYVSDLGDLHIFGAFARIDARGMRVKTGTVHPGVLTPAAFSRLDARKLHAEGITAVRVQGTVGPEHANAGLRVLGSRGGLDAEVGYGRPVDLLLYGAEGDLRAVVVNGHLIER